MTRLCCPYLVSEKAAFRGNLDLSTPAQVSVIVTWYCTHPFHGLRLELGDARGEAEKQCEACSLPRQPGTDAG
jgi:hypothetical protein